jgi:N-succinyldiaminopimelate aminotransferase
MTGSPDNVYSAYSQLAQETGAVNLGQGFPDDPAPAWLLESAVRAVRDGHNQYPPTRGLPVLRAAIAEHQAHHYDVELDQDRQVVVTTGASEAITATLLAVMQPGDEALMVDPCYDLYPAGVALARGTAVRVRSIDDLARAVSPRTRVIVLNSPGNPDGALWTAEDLAQVGALAERHDLVVIADEVYEHIVLGARPHLCAQSEPTLKKRTVVVSSAAKSLCVTGWKVGWATGPAPLIDAVHQAKSMMSFASGTPFQLAVADALPRLDEHVTSLVTAYRERRDQLAQALNERGWPAPIPEGGYFLLADVSGSGVRTTAELEQFCRRLPATTGVVGIPGSVFSQGGDVTTVRFCFAKSDERIDEATRRLRTVTRDP